MQEGGCKEIQVLLAYYILEIMRPEHREGRRAL
jgi:hypothetical protein